MPSKSLRKVQKHIGKKKGRTPALHEKSRDAQRLRRASARSDKLSKVGKARANLNQPLRMCRLTSEWPKHWCENRNLVERITHIQGLALNRNHPFTAEEVLSFIEKSAGPHAPFKSYGINDLVVTISAMTRSSWNSMQSADPDDHQVHGKIC